MGRGQRAEGNYNFLGSYCALTGKFELPRLTAARKADMEPPLCALLPTVFDYTNWVPLP